jgi:hypothetical protein
MRAKVVREISVPKAYPWIENGQNHITGAEVPTVSKIRCINILIATIKVIDLDLEINSRITARTNMNKGV